MNFNNETTQQIIQNFNQAKSGDFSTVLRVNGDSYLNVKDLCTGIVSASALQVIVLMFAVNFTVWCFWKYFHLKDWDYTFFEKYTFSLTYMLLVFNICCLVYLFVIVYNGV